MTVTDSDPADDDLWSSATPTPGSTPLCGGDDGTFTFTTDPTKSSSTFDAGGILADTTADSLDFGFAGVQNVAASTSDTTSPSASATTQLVSTGGWKITLAANPNTSPASGPTDVTNGTQNWLIGQQVDLTAVWGGPAADMSAGSWNITGDVLGGINEPASKAQRSTVPLFPPVEPSYASNLLRFVMMSDPKVSFFWESTPNFGQNFQACRVSYGGASTTFDVFTPTPSATDIAGTAGIAPFKSGWEVGLNRNPITGKGIQWTASVETPSGHGFTQGNFEFLQVVKPDETIFGTTPLPDKLQWGLDKSDPYGNLDYLTDLGQPSISGDTPHVNMSVAAQLYDSGTFTTSVMYKPPGAESEWVPLEAMAWSFSVEVDVKSRVPAIVPANTFQVIGYFSRTVEEPHWNGIWVQNPASGTVMLTGRIPGLGD